MRLIWTARAYHTDRHLPDGLELVCASVADESALRKLQHALGLSRLADLLDLDDWVAHLLCPARHEGVDVLKRRCGQKKHHFPMGADLPTFPEASFRASHKSVVCVLLYW
jgi:hypothetical protein